MKKIFYKKTIQNLGIFAFLAVILTILILPSYSILSASVKEDIINDCNKKITGQFKLMENEIAIEKSVLREMTATEEFSVLSNPEMYGYTSSSVKWLESREGIRDKFSGLSSVAAIQDKTMLMFRKGEMQIDIKGANSSLSSGYGTMWNLSYNGEAYSYEGAFAQIFMKNHSGKVDSTVCYNDILGEQTLELVYALTLSSADKDVGDAVFVVCFDGEKLVKELGFDGSAVSLAITDAKDSKIYGFGNNYNISDYDSSVKSDNLGITIHYSVSDNLIKNKLSPINFFLMIFVIGFIIFGLIATIGVSFVETRHIKKIVSVVNGTTDVEYSSEDDYFKYLETVFKSLYDNGNKITDSLKGLIFLKMLHFKLSEEEMEIIQNLWNPPVYVLMFKNTTPKYRNLKQDILLYLKDKRLEINYIEHIENSEVLVIARKTAGAKEIFEDMIVYLNKEHHTDIRGVVSICEDAPFMPVIYGNMRKTISYSEYGSLKSIEFDMHSSLENSFKLFMQKSRKLYEIIRSGNEFEAKRLVYEQWYRVTQGEIHPEEVESLFFSQSTVLSQVAAENKLNIAVPHFEREKDAVSIAFGITECIEQICEKLKGGQKREDVRASQIVDYIEQRYCDSSFYMPELVGKFELSDRAIVQILKKATGDNFSNYVGKLRISKAKELLSTTNIPISEVASQSGFESSNSFYKAFKKMYGVSPSVYRENCKKELEGDK